MAQIEIDEGEFRALQARAAAGEDSRKVVEALSANPKTRMPFLSALKVISPGTVIPEIDAAQPVLAELAKTNKRFEELQAAMATRDAEDTKRRMSDSSQQQIETGRASLRKQGYDAAAITAIEKLMTDEGIVKYEIAAAAFDKLNPPAEPIIGGNYGRDFGLTNVTEGDSDHKLLLDNPTAWKNKEVNKWLAERRDQRRHV